MPFNQMSGLPMDLAVYGSGSGAAAVQRRARDYERFLARVRQFPRWADGAIALMRTGMARGITLPRPAVAKMIPQLRDTRHADARGQHFLGADHRHARRLSRRPTASASPRRIAAALGAGSAAGLRAARGLPRARLSTGGAHQRRLERSAGRRGLVSLAHPRRHHHGHGAGRDPPAGPRRGGAHPRRNARGEGAGGIQGRPAGVLQVPAERSAVLFRPASSNCSTPIAT